MFCMETIRRSLLIKGIKPEVFREGHVLIESCPVEPRAVLRSRNKDFGILAEQSSFFSPAAFSNNRDYANKQSNPLWNLKMQRKLVLSITGTGPRSRIKRPLLSAATSLPYPSRGKESEDGRMRRSSSPKASAPFGAAGTEEYEKFFLPRRAIFCGFVCGSTTNVESGFN